MSQKHKTIDLKNVMRYLIIGLLIAGFSLMNAEENIMQKFTDYNRDRSQENLLEALRYYHQLKEQEPEDYQIPLLLSYIHYIELNGYITHLLDNIEEMYPRTQFQFANLLLSLNQYDQSIEIYLLVTEQLPQWSCAWRHMGEALFYAGELEEAEYALLEAINTRIEHYDAYVWLAFVQKEMENYEQALETLKTGLSYYGKDIEDPEEEVDALDVKFMLLELYQKNNMTDEYETIRQQLLQTAPEDPRWDGVRQLMEFH